MNDVIEIIRDKLRKQFTHTSLEALAATDKMPDNLALAPYRLLAEIDRLRGVEEKQEHLLAVVQAVANANHDGCSGLLSAGVIEQARALVAERARKDR